MTQVTDDSCNQAASRETGAVKQSSDRPLISIVTATFNAGRLLPFTVASLNSQSCREFEWIVVDGASTDDTIHVLKACANVPLQLISEPDRGVYDAWNKACQLARGEWLLFLGAGDELITVDTLAKCCVELQRVPKGTRIAYGQLELVSEVGRRRLDVFGKPWKEILGRWEIGRPALPPHGACFHHRSLFTMQEPFDLRFPIAADAHFLLRHLFSPEASRPWFLSFLVTRTPIGGLSFRLGAVSRIHADILLIRHELGLTPPLGHRIVEALRRAVARLLAILPQHLAHAIADGLRRLMGKPARWTVR